MRVLKAIIFDLNGTLLDDYEYNIRAFQRVFERFGLKIAHQQIDARIGKPTSHVIGEILREYGLEEDPMELAREKVENYRKLTEGKDLFFPGTVETLQALKGGYRLGLFTGVTRMQVEALGGFLELFEMIVAGEEAIKPKPAPDTLLSMAERMGLEPRECAYVADMPQDMRTAADAGMTAIGIENRWFSRQALREAGATRVIGKIAELGLLYQGAVGRTSVGERRA